MLRSSCFLPYTPAHGPHSCLFSCAFASYHFLVDYVATSSRALRMSMRITPASSKCSSFKFVFVCLSRLGLSVSYVGSEHASCVARGHRPMVQYYQRLPHLRSVSQRLLRALAIVRTSFSMYIRIIRVLSWPFAFCS